MPPAARVTDPTGHPGIITGPGVVNVLIGGLPAAVLGDLHACSMPPPPEQKDQVVFETERAIGIAAAKLTDVFSLWPGRDQYLDHSAAFLAGQAFQLFRKPLLQDTPHEIYLAHDTLLALVAPRSRWSAS